MPSAIPLTQSHEARSDPEMYPAMAALPSTRAATIRRFIYLIIGGGNDTHTLHRIDTSPLFAAAVGVGVRAQQEPGPGTAPPRATLPRPLARFDCAGARQFLPLGCGVEKIVGVDRHRHTVIFDTRTDSVRAGPDACYVKWHAWGDTWAEAGGRLYHLGRGPGFEEQNCLDFEALTYDGHRDDWFWSLLPSPPFESYSPMYNRIHSFADAGVGEVTSAIRISSYDGTYAFNAASASWHKQGDWSLPFHGRAQYVADYGLWFGFADNSDLCAADLNTANKPVHRHVWANVDRHANHAGNQLEFSYLSYLGSGRFCVTRFSRENMDNDGRFNRTAVVTAVEATRAAASATDEMQMVRRASLHYQSPGGRYHNSVRVWPSGPCWAY